jgi:ribosome-associated translation inhibitor RaiA
LKLPACLLEGGGPNREDFTPAVPFSKVALSAPISTFFNGKLLPGVFVFSKKRTMHKLIIHTIMAFALLFSACNSQQQAEELLEEEVYAIHDEVMPKMSEIQRLARQLRGIQNDSLSIDPARRIQISEVVFQLEKADEGMMAWMNAFKQPGTLRSSKSHEEIMAYLAGEKIRMEKVKSDMLTSIDAAKALLQSLNEGK